VFVVRLLSGLRLRRFAAEKKLLASVSAAFGIMSSAFDFGL
jgi:hypothetical protein